jgi:hypothetical protein
MQSLYSNGASEKDITDLKVANTLGGFEALTAVVMKSFIFLDRRESQ